MTARRRRIVRRRRDDTAELELVERWFGAHRPVAEGGLLCGHGGARIDRLPTADEQARGRR